MDGIEARPVADQSVAQLDGPGNLLVRQRADHVNHGRGALDRATRAVAPLASPCQLASRGLTRGAGALEHLLPLPRGEHASTPRSVP